MKKTLFLFLLAAPAAFGAKQVILLTPGGTSLAAGGAMINSNFTELYNRAFSTNLTAWHGVAPGTGVAAMLAEAINTGGGPVSKSYADSTYLVNGSPATVTELTVTDFIEASGKNLAIGDITLGTVINFPDNTRQTFNPGTATPGLNVGSYAGNPSTPSNGDVWYNSTANELRARIDGTSVTLGAGGGSGSVATDTIFDAAGDQVIGTGSNTSARVAIGTAGQLWHVNAGATAPEWTSAPSVSTLGVSGTATIGSMSFEGATADANETALAVTDPTADRTITLPDATGTVVLSGLETDAFIIAISDETAALTTGTAKVTFRAPYAFTITSVKGSLTTVSSSGTPTWDINEAGTTILSTKLTIDASEKTSTTAATAAVVSDAAIAADAEITIDIDTAGTGAAGGKVVIVHTH